MRTDPLLQELLTLERAALNRWADGDTVGYASTMSDDATYFDHATPELTRGIEAVKNHVRAFHGTFKIPGFDIVNPIVHQSADLAVLAFNWDPHGPDGQVTARWNATSVYRRVDGQWRMIHAHWAIAAARP